MSRSRKSQRTLKLDPRLDTAAAQKIHETLSRRAGNSLTLDLSEVRWIGTACAELLVSAHKTWGAGPHELTFVNPTPEFADGMETLGLGAWLHSTRIHAP